MRNPSNLLVTAFLFFCASTFAQNKIPLINSGEILVKGNKLHDDRKYKEAIDLYKQIDRSDTNYSKALYEICLSSYYDSSFVECKKYARLGLKLFPEDAPQWYLQIANAEDDLGNKDSAIAYYEKIISLNKYDYSNWFNRGVAFYKMKKYAEAKKSLQQCLLIYPYHASAHYYLGVISLEEGKPVQALLSFCSNLIINPENRYSGKSITALSAIAEAKDDVIKKANTAKKETGDDFELVQEILLSKASLDRNYKLKTSLEDHITRQIQVVLEKIEYNNTDNGFWMQYYVPLYKQIYDNNNFEAFTFYIFSAINNSMVKDYVKKNQKKIDGIVNQTIAYLTPIKETQVLNFEKRETAKERFLFNGKNVSGKGSWVPDNKDVKLVGPWEFYYANGTLRSKGSFNDAGNKTGDWVFYYSNGQLKETGVYANGEVNGVVNSWYSNGVKSAITNYKNDKVDGSLQQWYYNAAPRKTETYTNDKKNGLSKGYTNYGYPNYEGKFVDDLEEGLFTYYHSNGKVQYVINYTKGKSNGDYKKYYDNGVLQLEGSLTDDKKNGIWKEYHINGKIKSENNYVNNELDGECKDYFDNGQLLQKTNYSKGKVEGKSEDFDEDGKVFCESNYEKGRLKDIKFFDKTGTVISNTTTRRGAANLIFYDANGNKNSEGFFAKDGARNGKTNFFYRNGKISSDCEYKDGLLNGVKKTYFINGNLSEEINYVNDEEDGYYTQYYSNKIVKHEGWMVNDKKEGLHIDYDRFGKVYNKAYYLNGENNGYLEYYHPNGKIDYEQKYENGWVNHLTQFDTVGNVIEDIDMPQGNGKFTFKYYNGKPYIIGQYKNNHLHGEYKSLFFDGSTSYLTYYNQGSFDSTSKTFFYGGKLKSEGKYKLGVRVGSWKYYYENGQVYYIDNYKNGEIEGPCIMYNEDGTKDKELNYSNSQLDGAYKVYGENNQLAYQLNYHHNRIISYTYEGADGKLLPAKPVKNGTFNLVAFFKNGTKSAELDFEDDNVHGKRKLYFTNGKTYIDGARVMGSDEGSKKVYYVNGQLEKEEFYVSDELNGNIKTYYANGKLKSEENYYLGQLHGEAKYFDETGKLLQTRNYFYDLLQQVKK